MPDATQQTPSLAEETLQNSAQQSGQPLQMTPSMNQAPADNTPQAPQAAPTLAQQTPAAPPAPTATDNAVAFTQAAKTPVNRLFRGIVSGAIAGMSAPTNGASPNVGAAVSAVQQGREKDQQRMDELTKQNTDRDERQNQRNFENKIQLSDLELRKAADARQQIQSIQNTQEFNNHMKILDQNIETGNYLKAQRGIDAIQKSLDQYNTIQSAGGKPLMIDGKPVEYDNTPEGQKQLETDAHSDPHFFIKDFTTRQVLNPNTGKISVYEVPSEEREFQVKDDSGKMQTVRMRPTDFITYQEKIASIRSLNMDRQLKATEIKERIEAGKKDKEYDSALKNYDEVNGDVTDPRFKPSSRAVLGAAEMKNYNLAVAGWKKAQDSGDAEMTQTMADQVKRSASIVASLYAGRGPKAANGTPQAPDAAPPVGQQLTPVDTSMFHQTHAKGITTENIPGTTEDQSKKIYSDLNAMTSPADRKKYIAGLQIADTDKQKLVDASLKSEKKPAEETVNIISPVDGKAKAIPLSQKDAALKAGGTLASE